MEESMAGELGRFDPGYDQRAAFEEAVHNLLKLDAEGSCIVKLFAQAMIDYDKLQPDRSDARGGI